MKTNKKITAMSSQSLGNGGFLPDTFLEEVDQFLEDTESEDESADCDPGTVSSIISTSSFTPLSTSASGTSTRQSIEKTPNRSTADHPTTAVTVRPAKSALKKTSSYNGLVELNGELEVIPVRTEKSAWKTLPAPCTQPIRRIISSPNLEGNVESGIRRNVSFSQILIRDYEMTIGCNPSCSDGVPVELDWAYQELVPLPVDAYEEHRGSHRRSRQEMRLGPVMRRDIVREAGVSRGEIKEAQKMAAKIQRQRAATLSKASLMPIEAMIESAARKIKRGLGKTMGRSKSSDALINL
jgi:hypothetical protein